MVEVEVAQDDDVDVGVAHPGRDEAVEQHVPRLDDAVAIAQIRGEEGADAGLEEDAAAAVLDDEQRAAGEGDAVSLVGVDPALPQRARRVAEHGAAVEALAVAGDGPQTSRAAGRGCVGHGDSWGIRSRPA